MGRDQGWMTARVGAERFGARGAGRGSPGARGEHGGILRPCRRGPSRVRVRSGGDVLANW